MNCNSEESICRKDKTEQISFCEIRVKGHLNCDWSGWFDELTITHEPQGISLLSGPFVDQAALYRILKKLHEIGLPLVSFKIVKTDPIELHKERKEVEHIQTK